MNNEQVIRQVQQNGRRFDVCLAPEIREALDVQKGDNVSFERDDDSDAVLLRKVAQPPELDAEDSPVENSGVERVPLEADHVGRRRKNQQNPTDKIEFCPNCGTDDIRVDGAECVCYDCDATFAVTANGVKLVDAKHSEKINGLESRIVRVEDLLQNMGETMNGETDDDDDDDVNLVGQLIEAVFPASKNAKPKPRSALTESERQDIKDGYWGSDRLAAELGDDEDD